MLSPILDMVEVVGNLFLKGKHNMLSPILDMVEVVGNLFLKGKHNCTIVFT